MTYSVDPAEKNMECLHLHPRKIRDKSDN